MQKPLTAKVNFASRVLADWKLDGKNYLAASDYLGLTSRQKYELKLLG